MSDGPWQVQAVGRKRWSVELGFVDAEGMGDQGVKYDTLLLTPVLLFSKVS